jgi:hypothetical protein
MFFLTIQGMADLVYERNAQSKQRTSNLRGGYFREILLKKLRVRTVEENPVGVLACLQLCRIAGYEDFRKIRSPGAW